MCTISSPKLSSKQHLPARRRAFSEARGRLVDWFMLGAILVYSFGGQLVGRGWLRG